jgi:hypothetical protein
MLLTTVRPRPTEHELLELEGLGEVVVGAESEAGGLVVEPVGGGEHQDRHAAAGGDDALGDLVAGRPGDVSIENGDVVGVDAQQLQRAAAVTGDVGRGGFQAQPIPDGFGHIRLVLDDQHTHAPIVKATHIAGVSKAAYMLATPRCLDWEACRTANKHEQQPALTNRPCTDAAAAARSLARC